jgi:nitrogen-specific signal transduction histidine kinase
MGTLADYAQLSLTLDEIAWPMLLVDAEQRVLAANAPAARLLVRDADALRGQPLSSALVPEADADPQDERWTAVNSDGIALEVSASRIHLHDGRAGTLLLLRDRSQERLLLEEQVKTAELTGIFGTIATVNHEINNPLFGLMATLQLLRQELGPQSASIERKLDRMEQCSERIKQITDDLSRVIRPARRTYAADEGMLDLDRATRAPGRPAAPPAKES